jgi:hypothetical protein
VGDEDGLKAVSLSRGRLSFATPEIADALLPGLNIPNLPYMAAVALRSTDLSETRKVLEEKGVVPLVADDAVLVVGPRDGAGAYIVFHAPGVANVWSALKA